MQELSSEEVLKKLHDDKIEFIRLQFTDVLGHLKNVAVDIDHLQDALDNKIMFDGSSVDGYGRVEESDMYLRPDTGTLAYLPWRPTEEGVARFICDVYRPDGYPCEGDSRMQLKKVLEEMEEEFGYTFEVGAECEFYLFHTDEVGRPTLITHDRSSYFDLEPLDLGGDTRRKICLGLKKMGFLVETSHHEVGNGQQEIDFGHTDALTAADNIMTFKLAVKAIAKQNGLYATFLPKPKDGESGSGMHINMSLMKDGENVFYDRTNKNKNGMSDTAMWFMAGILKHISGITLLCNPIVNSYKRLIEGYEAPVYITWSEHNRSPLIRIPDMRGMATRLELRSPDTAANPYLLLAACLKAGLDGIRNHMEPPGETIRNVFLMSDEEKAALRKLPSNMEHALDEYYHDPLIREALGDHIFTTYGKMKETEWKEYQSSVTDWEIRRYLHEY